MSFAREQMFPLVWSADMNFGYVSWAALTGSFFIEVRFTQDNRSDYLRGGIIYVHSTLLFRHH
jgi:hypothetical protein